MLLTYGNKMPFLTKMQTKKTKFRRRSIIFNGSYTIIKCEMLLIYSLTDIQMESDQPLVHGKMQQ